jgi:hypothetical protein
VTAGIIYFGLVQSIIIKHGSTTKTIEADFNLQKSFASNLSTNSDIVEITFPSDYNNSEVKIKFNGIFGGYKWNNKTAQTYQKINLSLIEIYLG